VKVIGRTNIIQAYQYNVIALLNFAGYLKTKNKGIDIRLDVNLKNMLS
jgi:hypothetical protein